MPSEAELAAAAHYHQPPAASTGLGCNIVQSDQFTNVQPAGESTYFQRIEFDYSRILIGAGNTEVGCLIRRCLTNAGVAAEPRVCADLL